jgi:subtilisin family serine protease
MRNKIKLNKVISLVGVFALIAMALAGAAPTTSAATATTRVIVQGNSLIQAAAAVTANGGQVTSNIDIINAVVADVPQANLERLSSAPGVVRVTPDREVKVNSTLNDDEGKGVEFQFPKVIGADKVWAKGDVGDGVTVAFLDTGIDTTFIDLRKGPGLLNWDNRYLAYYDAINKKLYNPLTMLLGPQDPNGHGTHVAGIVGNSSKADGLYREIGRAHV